MHEKVVRVRVFHTVQQVSHRDMLKLPSSSQPALKSLQAHCQVLRDEVFWGSTLPQLLAYSASC